MFSHLHVHTEYSMLDGLSRLRPLVKRARELGMDSLGITDHGGLYGAIDFYRMALSEGVKPIIGCEMYVAPGSRHSRSPSEKTPFHATVLAKDNTGYANLVKLVSKAHLEGFYYKPRIDRELIESYREGLIFLSGCPSGEVPSLIAQGRMDEARAAAGWYAEMFPDYHLELMQHGGVPELPTVNAGLMDLHRDLSIPIVATNDSHYIRREDAPLQDILICIHTNVKPIIGCEMYVAPGSRHSRSPSEKTPFHATVLAKDNTGYANLVKLVSKAHLEGFYYKPRIDRELIESYREGLIFLSGCPSGEVPSLIAQGRMDEARAAAGWYAEMFPDYHLELMQHGGVPELPTVNAGLMDLHRDLSIPIVATNDSHYVRREDAPLQDILICIHTNTNVNDEGRMRMTEDSYYLKSPQEMQSLFAETPDAVANTLAIAEKCNVEFDFSAMRLPEFQLPDGVDADDHLARLAREGLKRRLERVTEVEESRLEYELQVIKQTRYANYCLVVWDIARFVRERDIFFTVRGSAAGSLTLFALGITDVNPLEHNMIFERFLNIERHEMPDIDMDFQDDRREEVINYVVDKYGRDHVAQIITFGTLGARASIRDVGRALAMPYAEVDRIAKLVPFKLHITLDQAIEESEELKEIYGADESIKKLVDTARSLEGLTRHSSTHAAGVVISRDPVDEVVPLQRPIKADDNAVSMTQYSMEPIEALGFMKMDFLGLINLTVLAKARDMIAKTRGVNIVLRDIPLEDADTFAMLSAGETGGVFQLEGTGMTRSIKELKPSSLSDIAAMIALYRPGPMEHIETFVDRKRGRSQPDYPHAALKDILEETYGVIVYQDQVLQIVRAFAGYSMGEADIVRKAMGKKIPAIMAQEKEKFIKGALGQGHPEELTRRIFDLIEPFAGYAFAKPHAVSYGLISYWTAYLKMHYPAEYMVSLLNCNAGRPDKVTSAVEVCRRLGIRVYPPDVNRSEADFSISSDEDGRQCILFGMAAVKNAGRAAVEQLNEARKKDGPFTSVEHMCRATDLKGLKKTVESLIMAGAFDAWGDRGALLEVSDRIIGLSQSETAMRESGQTSMFDLFGETVPAPLAEIGLPDIKTPDHLKHQWERELLGLSLSNSSLAAASAPGSDTVVFRYDLNPTMADSTVVVRGQVSSTTDRYTRNGRPFTIATLSLMDGGLDVFVWEEQRTATRGLWEPGKVVEIIGTVRVRDDDQITISCKEASEYVQHIRDEVEDVSMNGTSTPEPPPSAAPIPEARVPQEQTRPATPNGSAVVNGDRSLNVRIRETGRSTEDQVLLDDVLRLLMDHLGDNEVRLEIATEGRIVTLQWPTVRVDASLELEQRLIEVLGPSGTASVESASA